MDSSQNGEDSPSSPNISLSLSPQGRSSSQPAIHPLSLSLSWCVRYTICARGLNGPRMDSDPALLPSHKAPNWTRDSSPSYSREVELSPMSEPFGPRRVLSVRLIHDSRENRLEVVVELLVRVGRTCVCSSRYAALVWSKHIQWEIGPWHEQYIVRWDPNRDIGRRV